MAVHRASCVSPKYIKVEILTHTVRTEIRMRETIKTEVE